MPRNIQLLKQIRKAANGVNQAVEDPNHKMQLSIADMFLNELMLQDDSRFYLEFIAEGKALLKEGCKLAKMPVPKLREDLTEETRIEVINREIEALKAALVPVVKALDEDRSPAEKDFLERLTLWESSQYKHRTEQVKLSEKAEAKAITPELVQRYIQQKHPEWKNLRVTKLVPLEGGISKKTILVDTEDSVNGPQSMVIRAEQPVNFLFFDGSDVAQEFYGIALMHKLGMPVPKPLWLEEDASHLGVRFIVTTKSEGKNVVGGLASLGIKDPLPKEVVESFLQVFYQMHNLKLDPSDPLVQKSHFGIWTAHKTIHDAARYNAQEFVPKLIRRAGIKESPQLLRGLRWLDRNAPDVQEAPVLVHVDYAFNNILFHNNRISAVLDWETSRLGDPCDDIIWTQHNLGVYSMPEFLKVYEKATGRHISEYRVAYAMVQKCMLNIIAGLTALDGLDGDDHTPIHMGVMGVKYMPLFGADLGELITKAESVKGK